jgi:hypothetical protein
VEVPLAVGVLVQETVGETVGVAVGVKVAVTVGVKVGVGLWVRVRVGVGLTVGVELGVEEGVGVCVKVPVEVAEEVGVGLAVEVRVKVAVEVGVKVEVEQPATLVVTALDCTVRGELDEPMMAELTIEEPHAPVTAAVQVTAWRPPQVLVMFQVTALPDKPQFTPPLQAW